MKNLLIYINPEKKFTDGWGDEIEKLVKVQIDNSIELGWSNEDIMLVTNFPYEYNGVKATEIGDENFCSYKATVSKIYAIIDLFKRGLIGKDIYWFHDFDAFQLEPLDEKLENHDMAMTDYGIMSLNNVNNLRPSTGTIFFKDTARDIFETWKQETDACLKNEEVSLLAMSHKSRFKPLFDRMKKLNITYNFAIRRRNVELTYGICELPIRVIHFHPFDRRRVYYLRPDSDNIDVVIKGNNPMKKVLVNDRLLNIFKKHKII